jgi:hypothetical protein
LYNMMSRIIQSLVVATLITNVMCVVVKEALISDEGATSGIEEHHQYYGKAGKGSKGSAYYGGKGSKGYGGGYGSGNGDSEPVHEPEASGDWEPEHEPEPVHHESDDYYVYGKSSKGGKGSKGGYGSGNDDSEPVHEPEASGDWEPELEPEPVLHESDDYYVYGKSSKGGKGSKGGYGNGDGHYADPEAEPELAGNSGSGDWW